MLRMDDLAQTEPDCPNCRTRCVVIHGHYVCRACKVTVLLTAGG